MYDETRGLVALAIDGGAVILDQSVWSLAATAKAQEALDEARRHLASADGATAPATKTRRLRKAIIALLVFKEIAEVA